MNQYVMTSLLTDLAGFDFHVHAAADVEALRRRLQRPQLPPPQLRLPRRVLHVVHLKYIHIKNFYVIIGSFPIKDFNIDISLFIHCKLRLFPYVQVSSVAGTAHEDPVYLLVLCSNGKEVRPTVVLT